MEKDTPRVLPYISQPSHCSLFIAIISYKQSMEMVQKHLEDHRTFLNQCYEKGKFLISGRQVPSEEGGIIIAKVDSKEELTLLLQEDPFYKKEIADFKIIEFTPTKYLQIFQDIV